MSKKHQIFVTTKNYSVDIYEEALRELIFLILKNATLVKNHFTTIVSLGLLWHFPEHFPEHYGNSRIRLQNLTKTGVIC